MTIWKSRGYLPHIDGLNLFQHITFHLADSVPRNAIDRMQRELDALPKEQQEQQRQQRIQHLLDKGSGSCLLKRNDCAEIVQESILHGDCERYRLIAWVIMPNHVHVLIQSGNFPLASIVQSWKRHTSRHIHQIFAPTSTNSTTTPPPLWHREYWDRYVRDDLHFKAVTNYIEQNPVNANLVQRAGDWVWGCARLRGDR